MALNCLMDAKRRAKREDEAATSEAGTSLTIRAMASVIAVRLIPKILFDHESSWSRVDAQIRSENELIYSRD